VNSDIRRKPQMATTATLSRPASTAPRHAPAVPSVSIDSLARTPLAALTQPSSPSVEVYASTEDTLPKLLWDQHSRIGDDHLSEMRKFRGHFSFWVKKTDFSRVQTAVQTHWAELAATHSLHKCDSLALLSMTFSLELNATIRLVKCLPFLSTARRVGEATGVIFSRPGNAIETSALVDAVNSVSGCGFRALHVTFYTLQMAMLTGIVDAETLGDIAVGALVHDVGARNLFVDAWANPGRWSAEERDMVERHPQVSYEDLRPQSFSHAQLMMAYQHHERIDGTGYPVGIVGDEIHPWAKMLALADRFEALTSGRAYRKPFTLPEAIKQLAIDAGAHLDRELTQCWIQSLRSN
jgi:hypothetical protein